MSFQKLVVLFALMTISIPTLLAVQASVVRLVTKVTSSSLWLQLKFGTVTNCYPSANCPASAACKARDLVASISQWQLASRQD